MGGDNGALMGNAMRRSLALALALALLAWPALANPKARTKIVDAAPITFTTGDPTIVRWLGPDFGPVRPSGYIVIRTTNEVNDATLTLKVEQRPDAPTPIVILSCPPIAMTTNTTTVISFGTAAVAAEGVDFACPQLATRRHRIKLFMAGVDASMDVEIEVMWAAGTGH